MWSGNEVKLWVMSKPSWCWLDPLKHYQIYNKFDLVYSLKIQMMSHMTCNTKSMPLAAFGRYSVSGLTQWFLENFLLLISTVQVPRYLYMIHLVRLNILFHIRKLLDIEQNYIFMNFTTLMMFITSLQVSNIQDMFIVYYCNFSMI